MTLFPGFATEDGSRSAQDALHYPIGAASPLWFAYAGAAGAGVAYWWLTRWTQPANLEAAFGGWLKPEEAAVAFEAPPVPAVVEETVELVEAAVEDTVEAVTEVIEDVALPVAEAVEVATEAVVAETVAVADDLTRVVGIGPKLAVRLADLGVKSFKDIAVWTDADLAQFDKALDLKGRAVRDAWIAQARRFSEA